MNVDSIDRRELEVLIELTEKGLLNEEQRMQVARCLRTFLHAQTMYQTQDLENRKLLNMLFGSRSEKRVKPGGNAKQESSAQGPEEKRKDSTSAKKMRKGHGRIPAEAYVGAKRITVPHSELKAGGPCPLCPRGTLFRYEPAVMIQISGSPLLGATRYELERLRCGDCGGLFTASPPPQTRGEKYDEKAKAMVVLNKYLLGVPLYRLAFAQQQLGVPMPAGTQYQLVEEVAKTLEPILTQLMDLASDAELFYVDDTGFPILSVIKERRLNPEKRTGTHMTGVVAQCGRHQIVLFFTGKEHAGENMDRILSMRRHGLSPPIQMSDALSCNTSHPHQVIWACCTVHARRNFWEIRHNFTEACERLIEDLGQVFEHEARCKKEGLDDHARMHFHKEHSGPIMNKLRDWMKHDLTECQVEENSTLGRAMNYMIRHWDGLTRFLNTPGAPLDNNLAEMILKPGVLLRKNALFFKTLPGAEVGSKLMSIIQTCIRNHCNPYHYLIAVLNNAHDVARLPEAWLPWTYQQRLAELGQLKQIQAPSAG